MLPAPAGSGAIKPRSLHQDTGNLAGKGISYEFKQQIIQLMPHNPVSNGHAVDKKGNAIWDAGT
jgi:hypothetical protein